MNKKVLVAIVVLILLVVVGGALFMLKGKSPSSQEVTGAQPTNTEKQGVFGSIADALSKQMTLTCDFTTEIGSHIVSFVKNGKIRADMTGKTPQETGSVIMKDKKIYFWNSSMAMVMEMPTVSVTPSASGQTSTGQDMMGEMEKYKQSCKTAAVADSMFDLPANVKFQNFSEMMHPTTTTTSGGTSTASPSDYQHYMQQYQQYMQK